MIPKVGDTVRVYGRFLVNGVATDPTSIALVITDPSSNVATIAYPGAPSPIVRTDVGEFHYDLAIDEAGRWLYEWRLDGSGVAASSGEVQTSLPFRFRTQTEDELSAQFVDISVLDADLNPVASARTNALALATIELAPGAYVVRATRFAWRFDEQIVELSTLAPVDPDVVLIGVPELRWLKVSDLEVCGSADNIDRLFCDAGTSTRNLAIMQAVMMNAEAQAESYLLRSWSREAIVSLAYHDSTLRMHAAWIALELACERKHEFLAEDGKGRYWAQYERAIEFFERLAKSSLASRGEKAATQLGHPAAGKSANTGGMRRPSPNDGPLWVFSDEPNGRKHGGF